MMKNMKKGEMVRGSLTILSILMIAITFLAFSCGTVVAQEDPTVRVTLDLGNPAGVDWVRVVEIKFTHGGVVFAHFSQYTPPGLLFVQKQELHGPTTDWAEFDLDKMPTDMEFVYLSNSGGPLTYTIPNLQMGKDYTVIEADGTHRTGPSAGDPPNETRIRALVPSVGGVVIPIDKFGLLTPYIGLASTILAATVASTVYVKRVKRRKEKQ